jgi:hypothetical protein
MYLFFIGFRRLFLLLFLFLLSLHFLLLCPSFFDGSFKAWNAHFFFNSLLNGRVWLPACLLFLFNEIRTVFEPVWLSAKAVFLPEFLFLRLSLEGY